MSDTITEANVKVTTVEAGFARVEVNGRDIGRVTRRDDYLGGGWKYRYAWRKKGDANPTFATRAKAVDALVARHEGAHRGRGH